MRPLEHSEVRHALVGNLRREVSNALDLDSASLRSFEADQNSR